MKQRKRIAAFVLAAAMVFSTLPLNVLAVETQQLPQVCVSITLSTSPTAATPKVQREPPVTMNTTRTAIPL